MAWCIQCGELRVPEKATGVDDEGEPACGMHLKRAPAEFNGDFIDKGLQRHYGAAELDSLEIEPVAKKADMIFKAKECVKCGDEFTPSGPRSTHCDTCKQGAAKARVVAVDPVLNEITLEPAVELKREPEITIRLTASKVEKMLSLLLQ